MQHESRAQALGRMLFALVCMIMIALAAGAVWVVLALYAPAARVWLALPAGAAIGYSMRAWIVSTRFSAMALAVVGTLLAAVYMKCLFAALQLAAITGTGFVETLRRAGPDMLLSLARLSLNIEMLVVCLLAAALAAWVASRDRHPHQAA